MHAVSLALPFLAYPAPGQFAFEAKCLADFRATPTSRARRSALLCLARSEEITSTLYRFELSDGGVLRSLSLKSQLRVARG